MWQITGCIVVAYLFAINGVAASQKERQWPVRSCHPKIGMLCFPTACSNYSCALLNNTVCIPDRCGCEARIFTDVSGAYREVTRMCKIVEAWKLQKMAANETNAPAEIQSLYDLRTFVQLMRELIVDLSTSLRNRTGKAKGTDRHRERLLVLQLNKLKRVEDSISQASDEAVKEGPSGLRGVIEPALKSVAEVSQTILNSSSPFSRELQRGKPLFTNLDVGRFSSRLLSEIFSGASSIIDLSGEFFHFPILPPGGTSSIGIIPGLIKRPINVTTTAAPSPFSIFSDGEDDHVHEGQEHQDEFL